MRRYAYIDASNLFYGGKKSLGWSIDYEKLFKYLEDRYGVTQVFFFGGVEIHDFPFNYLDHDTVPIEELSKYLVKLIEDKGDIMNEATLKLIERHLKRVRFYLKLQKFDYKLILKPVKTFNGTDGLTVRKANCDVDMAFYLMRDRHSFESVLILSGDGDFLPVLKFLRENRKEVLILARGPRTAKEIRRFAGGEFRDFEYLKNYLEYQEK